MAPTVACQDPAEGANDEPAYVRDHVRRWIKTHQYEQQHASQDAAEHHRPNGPSSTPEP